MAKTRQEVLRVVEFRGQQLLVGLQYDQCVIGTRVRPLPHGHWRVEGF